MLHRLTRGSVSRVVEDQHHKEKAEGHIDEARVGDTLTGLRRICEDVRFLGSYPRADKLAPTTPENMSDASFSESRNWLNDIRHGRTI